MNSYVIVTGLDGELLPYVVVTDPYTLRDLADFCDIHQQMYDVPTHFYVCDASDHPNVEHWDRDTLNAVTNECQNTLREEMYIS